MWHIMRRRRAKVRVRVRKNMCAAIDSTRHPLPTGVCRYIDI